MCTLDCSCWPCRFSWCAVSSCCNFIHLNFADCSFTGTFVFTSLVERLTPLADGGIFMEPYKTSYSTKFSLPLTTNFDMTEFDRQSHLEGDVLSLQLFVSKSIHPLIYGVATPSGPWPPSEDASILLCLLLVSPILLLLWSVVCSSGRRPPIMFLVFPLVLYYEISSVSTCSGKIKTERNGTNLSKIFPEYFLILCYKLAVIFWGADWMLVLLISPRTMSFVNLVVGKKVWRSVIYYKFKLLDPFN
jgi:hypothetical protein